LTEGYWLEVRQQHLGRGARGEENVAQGLEEMSDV
jgi:hypothetical protein